MINNFRKFLENLEPVKSFKLKDELNPKIWTDFKIDESIREQLLQIAKDYYDSLELETEIVDIILIGSLANYNWSEKYSDYDLHIVVDISDINEDTELVEKFLKSKKKLWNWMHEIYIEGYDVEVHVEDVNNDRKSKGVFSLLNNKWISKPTKVDFEVDEELLKEKATGIMDAIDELEEVVEKESYDEFIEKLDKIWKKVKNYRKSGLETEESEFSTGNLVFKLLRRNGYIGKIMKLKRISYDKQFK